MDKYSKFSFEPPQSETDVRNGQNGMRSFFAIKFVYKLLVKKLTTFSCQTEG